MMWINVRLDILFNPYRNKNKQSILNTYPEENIQGMEQTMANLDTSMSQMLESLESMKPAYAYALQMLEKSSGASSGIEQKVHNRFAYVLEGLKYLF